MKHYLTAEWGRAVARLISGHSCWCLLALAAGLPLLWRFGSATCFRAASEIACPC